MLPTSARVSQEIYEPLIGVQYPMLHSHRQGQWHIGTTSIRASYTLDFHLYKALDKSI